MVDPERSNLDWMQTVAERKIAEAQEEGAFDDLPGKGQPLYIEDDPLTPAHLRVAHHVLKNAHVVPTWISLEQEIEAAKAEADACRDQWLLRKAREGGALAASQAQTGRAEYERLMRAANDMILRFNIVNPFVHRAPIPFRIKDRLAQWDTEFAGAPEATP